MFLDEFLDEIGVDAARWYLLSRGHDQAIEIDVDLAAERSQKNPVYYVQYAHARCANILRNVGEERVQRALPLQPAQLSLEAAERELTKKLLAFPGTVAEAAERRAPHRIAIYAHELAQALAAFYRDCPVRDAEPEDLKDFRIALTIAMAQS